MRGPTYDLTGTWEELAPMPGGPGFHSSDSLVLTDGRIVVFRADGNPEDLPWAGVVVYDPHAESWETATFAGDRPSVGTDQAFVLASDGRIYTHDYVIDPSGEEWSTTPFQLVRETDTWAGTPLATGPDGRIYRPADDSGSQRSQLIAYDPEADSFERSSFVTGKYHYVFPGGDELVLTGSDGIITYDPASDAWSASHPIEEDQLWTDHSAVGADGLVYAPGWFDSAEKLWAISPDDGSCRPVEPPEDLDWRAELVWGSDGRLYAFGPENAWAFTPDD